MPPRFSDQATTTAPSPATATAGRQTSRPGPVTSIGSPAWPSAKRSRRTWSPPPLGAKPAKLLGAFAERFEEFRPAWPVDDVGDPGTAAGVGRRGGKVLLLGAVSQRDPAGDALGFDLAVEVATGCAGGQVGERDLEVPPVRGDGQDGVRRGLQRHDHPVGRDDGPGRAGAGGLAPATLAANLRTTCVLACHASRPVTRSFLWNR